MTGDTGKIKTPGLSHLSYLIGSGGKAAVVDPRRDCEIYLEKARAEGLEITHIFETHQLSQAMSHLTRIGLDDVVGGYVGVVPAAANGIAMNATPMINTAMVKSKLEENAPNWTLLDVRDADERAQSAIEGSEHIYVGELNQRWSELDKNRHLTLMCASGMRATVAAGWLASRGFENLDIYLGSMGAWQAAQI